jgi:hypothetical protein
MEIPFSRDLRQVSDLTFILPWQLHGSVLDWQFDAI